MKNKYGIPYMGSKTSILKELCSIFSKAENFYDLFGGGFSVTNFMIVNRHNDFQFFHYNEIDSSIVQLVKDAIDGKYNYDVFKPELITKKRFDKEKKTNAYIRVIWSFGNNQRNYLFGSEIEKYKESMHNAIVFNKFDDLAKKILGLTTFNPNYSIKQRRLLLSDRAKRAQRLEWLERLERLQRLEDVKNIQKLNLYSRSYEQIDIKKDSIIYCDPPYKNTSKYLNSINYEKFYDWAYKQSSPVYISEYNIDDTRFKVIAKFKKMSLMLPDNRNTMIEKVYANKAGVEAFINYHKKNKCK